MLTKHHDAIIELLTSEAQIGLHAEDTSIANLTTVLKEPV